MASFAFPFVCPSATHPLTTKKTNPTNIRCLDLILVTPPRFVLFAHIAAIETRSFKLFHRLHLAAICDVLGKGQRSLPKNLSPYICSSPVCVAAPRRPLKELPDLATLSPQL